MKIAQKEPTMARYIYVNPLTNRVHLMLPIISGVDIGLDNTCKSLYALQEFFGKNSENASRKQSALEELTRYKQALLFDIGFLPDGHELRTKKQERLKQIDLYLNMVATIQNSPEMAVIQDRASFAADYPAALKSIMSDRSNLYSMVLRPAALDTALHSVSPVFSVTRCLTRWTEQGENFYTALMHAFQPLAGTLNLASPRDRLIQVTLDAQKDQPVDFKNIQSEMTKQFEALFHFNVNFEKSHDGRPITEEEVVALAPMPDSIIAEDYIDNLLHLCCSDSLWEQIPSNPFYDITSTTAGLDKLSILTQFYLAQINIHCFSHDISADNFGKVLDASPELSKALAATVINALRNNERVEEALTQFINTHTKDFHLAYPLTSEDINAIEKKFIVQYALIKDSPHFDEFTILDTSKSGKFVTHQGSICTDLSELIGTGYPLLDTEFIQQTRAEFQNLHVNGIIPHKNEIPQDIDLSINQLVYAFSRLKPANQKAFLALLGIDTINALIQDGNQLANELSIFTPEDQTAFIQLFGVEHIKNLIQHADQLVDLLSRLKPANQKALLASLGIETVKALIKDRDQLNDILQRLTPEKKIVLIIALNEHIKTLMTPDERNALITSLGIEHMKAVIYDWDQLNTLIMPLTTDDQAGLIQSLGMEYIGSIINDERELNDVLLKLLVKDQIVLIKSLGDHLKSITQEVCRLDLRFDKKTSYGNPAIYKHYCRLVCCLFEKRGSAEIQIALIQALGSEQTKLMIKDSMALSVVLDALSKKSSKAISALFESLGRDHLQSLIGNVEDLLYALDPFNEVEPIAALMTCLGDHLKSIVKEDEKQLILLFEQVGADKQTPLMTVMMPKLPLFMTQNNDVGKALDPYFTPEQRATMQSVKVLMSNLCEVYSEAHVQAFASALLGDDLSFFKTQFNQLVTSNPAGYALIAAFETSWPNKINTLLKLNLTDEKTTSLTSIKTTDEQGKNIFNAFKSRAQAMKNEGTDDKSEIEKKAPSSG